MRRRPTRCTAFWGARFKIPERRGDHIFDEIAGRLRNCAGVSEVECNPLTGSVLIHHSGNIDSPLMRAALHRFDEILELELAAPPVARRLRADVIGLDQAIKRLSDGKFDLSTVAALGSTGPGRQPAVGGAQPVIAITLPWYATERLRRWEEPPRSARPAARLTPTRADLDE